MLELRGVSKRFGGVVATDDVTLDIVRGEVHALIGPNGAGKTTLIGQISGVLPTEMGRIVFNGADVTYTSDLSIGEELRFDPPVVVTAGTPASVTIKLDLDSWFRSGGSLVDPATAAKGAENENLVRDNIMRSFHAFQDNDEDGMDDGHQGEDGGH